MRQGDLSSQVFFFLLPLLGEDLVVLHVLISITYRSVLLVRYEERAPGFDPNFFFFFPLFCPTFRRDEILPLRSPRFFLQALARL